MPDEAPDEWAKLVLMSDQKRDLDETRRLVYMALSVQHVPSGKEELAGTLINALVHHQQKGTLEEIAGIVHGALQGDQGSRDALLALIEAA